VPLLSFTSETEIGIVEMGANHKKEIEFLCELRNLTTNFGSTFGRIWWCFGVIEGKSEMYKHLSLNDKFVL
jgi:UDP-N-acetylmuramoyl-tripeptide--D-alanyl-D-alanine ligase